MDQLKNIIIAGGKDADALPFRYFRACLETAKADDATSNGSALSGTIAWTAEQK